MNLQISKPQLGGTLYKFASYSIHGPIPISLSIHPWIHKLYLKGSYVHLY